jgi:hypothetical protein
MTWHYTLLEQESHTNFGTDFINSGNEIVMRVDQELQASREYEARLRNDIENFKNGTTSTLGRELHERLRCIIAVENIELAVMESHLNNASDVILMLHHPSQQQSIERLIEEDNMAQAEKKPRLDLEEPNCQDLEMRQMQDDIRYEENAMTDRIIESFGGFFCDRDDDSGHSISTGEFNLDFFDYVKNQAEDINENTDTEDGAEDLIELVGTNTRLVHDLVGGNTKLVEFLAKQRETLARLRTRISRMKKHIERLTKRLNQLTEEHDEECDEESSADDTATVLVDTETDASLLIQPNLDSAELDYFNSTKVKRELDEKLASLQGTTEP